MSEKKVSLLSRLEDVDALLVKISDCLCIDASPNSSAECADGTVGRLLTATDILEQRVQMIYNEVVQLSGSEVVDRL